MHSLQNIYARIHLLVIIFISQKSTRKNKLTNKFVLILKNKNSKISFSSRVSNLTIKQLKELITNDNSKQFMKKITLLSVLSKSEKKVHSKVGGTRKKIYFEPFGSTGVFQF